ncbi:hypothetical protein G7046_g3797 [Stylonectria norvegica]|nr:hypothetical protein G7046_g3797 [Stylonectria norvegica]
MPGAHSKMPGGDRRSISGETFKLLGDFLNITGESSKNQARLVKFPGQLRRIQSRVLKPRPESAVYKNANETFNIDTIQLTPKNVNEQTDKDNDKLSTTKNVNEQTDKDNDKLSTIDFHPLPEKEGDEPRELTGQVIVKLGEMPRGDLLPIREVKTPTSPKGPVFPYPVTPEMPGSPASTSSMSLVTCSSTDELDDFLNEPECGIDYEQIRALAKGLHAFGYKLDAVRSLSDGPLGMIWTNEGKSLTNYMFHLYAHQTAQLEKIVAQRIIIVRQCRRIPDFTHPTIVNLRNHILDLVDEAELIDGDMEIAMDDWEDYRNDYDTNSVISFASTDESFFEIERPRTPTPD